MDNNHIFKKTIIGVAGSIFAFLMIFVICSHISYAEDPVPGEKPEAPAGLKIVYKADGLGLSWEGSEGAATYRIYKKTPKTKWAMLAETDGLSYIDTEMAAGTKYSYAVTAVNEALEESARTGPVSAIFYFRPEISFVRKANGIKIKIANETGAKKWRIYKTENGVRKILGKTVTKEFIDTNVKNAGEYIYQAACLDDANIRASAFSDKRTALFFTRPVIDISFTATGITTKWKGISKAPNYRVYCKEGNRDWKALKTLSGKEYEHGPLVEGRKYQFRVSVVSADKKEVLSARSVVQETRFYNPPEVNISINNPTSVRLKWSPKKGVSKYQIVRKGDDGSTKVFTVTREYDPNKKSFLYTDNKIKKTKPMKDSVLYKYYIRAGAVGKCVSASSTLVKGLLYTEKTRYLTIDNYTLHDSINDSIDSTAPDIDGPVSFSDVNRPLTFNKVPFNAKLKVKYIYKKTTGIWHKVIYTNKKGASVTGYLWEKYPGRDDYVQRLSKTKQAINYERYRPFVENTANSTEHKKWQKEIIKQALFFYNKPTQYCASHYGTQHSATYRSYDADSGKWDNITPKTKPYWFDCSNYVSYCLNKVMQKYIPTYKMSQSVDAQWGFNANSERTKDAGEEIKAKAEAAKMVYHDGNGGFVPQTVLENDSEDPSDYKIDPDKLEPCDLIFIYEPGADKTENKTRQVTHVLMYLGNNEVIHCTGKYDVTISKLTGTKYEKYFVGAIRMIPDATEPMDRTMTAETDLDIREQMDKNLKGIATIPENEEVKVLYQFQLVLTDTGNGIYSIQRRRSEISLRKTTESDQWHHTNTEDSDESWERYRYANDDTSWSYVEYKGIRGYVKSEYLQ